MKHRSPVVRAWARATTLGLAFSVVSCAAWAAKPEWAGKGKGKHEEESHAQNQQGGSVEIRVGSYFGDDQRRVAQSPRGLRLQAGRRPRRCRAQVRTLDRQPADAACSRSGLQRTASLFAHHVGVEPDSAVFVRLAIDALDFDIETGEQVGAPLEHF